MYRSVLLGLLEILYQGKSARSISSQIKSIIKTTLKKDSDLRWTQVLVVSGYVFYIVLGDLMRTHTIFLT